MCVKSKVPGVFWREKLGKYVASFKHGGVYRYFGCFSNLEEAEAPVIEYRKANGMDQPSNWYIDSDDYTTLFMRRRDASVVETIFDTEDFAKVYQKNWCATYSESMQSYYINQAGYKGVKFHRLIMDAPTGLYVDHINRNTLDNRKCNLRLVTHSANMQNRGVSYRNNVSSGIRGVTFMRRDNTWQAHCQIDKIKYTVGYFSSPEEAAIAVRAFRTKYMPFSEMDKEAA